MSLEEEELGHHLLCALLLGLHTLGFGSLLDGCQLDVTFECQKCVGCLENKDKKSSLEVWMMIPMAVWWTNWKKRNRWIFEGKDTSF